METNELLGAIARGWTHPENEKKVLDADLVFAITKEIKRSLQSKQRKWVGLTDDETSGFTQHEMTVVKYVSKVLQEKNNGN